MAGGHGGRRIGAGRKKGSPERHRTAEVRARCLEEHSSPLEFFVREMNNPENTLQFRAQMAQSAAPYFHTRLHAVAVHQTAPPHLDEDGNLHMTGAVDALPAPSVTSIRIISVPSGQYVDAEEVPIESSESAPAQDPHADEPA
jgi:hypothetical protein